MISAWPRIYMRDDQRLFFDKFFESTKDKEDVVAGGDADPYG